MAFAEPFPWATLPPPPQPWTAASPGGTFPWGQPGGKNPRSLPRGFTQTGQRHITSSASL